MTLRAEGDRLLCEGRLRSGEYLLPGNVSSQFISGLLMAFGGLAGDSVLRVTGMPESTPYIAMTEAALAQSGVFAERKDTVWSVKGGQAYALPASLQAEGDYSSATFFLCMGALGGEGVLVKGLDPASVQGDRAVLKILKDFGAQVSCSPDGVLVKKGALRGVTIDASQIPDAVPALAVVGALSEGVTRVVNAQRLRLKESDRIRSTCAMLRALGAQAEETADGLVIRGTPSLEGGAVDTFSDHRIAMAAAEAACGCRGPVTVMQPDCTAKSYPDFWEDYRTL